MGECWAGLGWAGLGLAGLERKIIMSKEVQREEMNDSTIAIIIQAGQVPYHDFSQSQIGNCKVEDL